MYCYQRNHHNFFMFIITIIIFIHLFIFYQNEKKTLPSVLFPSISKLSVQLWVILFPSQKMIINTVKLQLSFRLLLRWEARNSRSLICDPESTVYSLQVHSPQVHSPRVTSSLRSHMFDFLPSLCNLEEFFTFVSQLSYFHKAFVQNNF